jgi:hypothetical protein
VQEKKTDVALAGGLPPRRRVLARMDVLCMMGGGSEEVSVIDRMSEEVVRAMLEALPVETTVLDAHDEVIGWNKH